MATKKIISTLTDELTASVEETYPEEISLDALCAEINVYITATPKTFAMMEPVTLTVQKKDGNYSKRPHIGGEEFKISGVYKGKRNGLIYVFTPLAVADYKLMEMPESQAKKLLEGFGNYIKAGIGYDLTRQVEDAKKKVASADELVKNVEKFKQYEEIGFGSW